MFDFDRIHSAIAELRAKQIFFVCGHRKSGTTWLQLLLDSHPEVSCNGEGHFANQLLPSLTTALDEHNALIRGNNTAIFKELRGYPLFSKNHLAYLMGCGAALLLLEQSKNKAARAIGEKSPDNILHLDTLDAVFPGAKFVHIVRDGRDCATSLWFHNLRVSPEWTRENFASMEDFVRKFAEGWVASVRAGCRFGAQNSTRYLELRYEDLSTDPERTLEKAFRFLGVKCTADVVRQCCADGSFERLSGGRSRGQENRDSFFRKGTPGDWRNHFNDTMSKVFEEKAGNWLARFHYS